MQQGELEQPVFVADEVLQANPKFKELIATLAVRKIKPNGVSFKQHEEYEQAKMTMNKERERYLKKLIMLKMMKDLIQVNTSKPNPHMKLYEALDHLLVVAETQQDLPLPLGESGEEARYLFGLNRDELKDIALDSSNLTKDVPRIAQVVIRDLEASMEQLCKELTEFASTETQPISPSNASHLHTILTKRKAQMQNEKKLYSGEQLAKTKAFAEYYRFLSKTLNVVIEITQKYTLHEKFKQDEVYVKWLQTSCKCMLLKLSVLTNQILRDTYTPENVQALSRLRQRIERELRENKAELEEGVLRVKQYESVGMGFKDLANQYASLLHQLQNKQWALAELEKMSKQQEREEYL